MSFASPHPNIDIPDVTIYDLLFGDLTDEDKEVTAFVDYKSGTQTTYGELLARIDTAAGWFAARGIGPGSVVALLAPNSSAFGIILHGAIRAGAAVTTVNALYNESDIQKQLTLAGAKVLVTVSALAPAAVAAATSVGLTEADVVILDGGAHDSSDYAGHPTAADIFAQPLTPPTITIDPATAPAVIPFSSGTTGVPKGVVLTHRNLVANVLQAKPLLNVDKGDGVLAVLPFFHIYGLTVLLNLALLSRARLVVLPRMDLVDFLSAIVEQNCSRLFIAPPLAVALAKHPLIDEYDLSPVKSILSGAAPLDEELAKAVEQRLGATVTQGYGMSELSPISHATPQDRGESLVGSRAPASAVGWAIANTENKLVDPDTGAEIPLPATGLSAPGELWVKGPNVMAGYLNNPQATAETIDADGYLHTGDIAVADPTGLIFIVDRLKELIKYKGYQVPPAELEALLLTHPQIADAAVIGVLDAGGEEIPKAFVVVQPGQELTADDVIAFVAERTAPHKKVRAVEFIEAVPKSSAGKILRKDLRAQEKEKSATAGA